MSNDETPQLLRGSVTVKLSSPIQAHGKEVAELTLREPKGVDFRKCGESDSPEFIHKLISRLASIPMPSVDELAGRDFTAIAKTLGRFLEHPDGSEVPA